MKRIVFLILLLPFFSWSQGIKVNEFDRFIKQRRVESFPHTLKAGANFQMAISFISIGTSFYIQLSGYGIGANLIGSDDRVILLLDNDSTVTVKSTGAQSYELGSVNTYKHNYSISLPDLEKMSQNNLQALRKYRLEKFDDVDVPKDNGEKVKKLSSLFIEELRKAKVLPLVLPINLRDISRHIGDSVSIEGKVSNGRYFAENNDTLTLLDVGTTLPNEVFTAVIRGADRKNFVAEPEHFFEGKEVRITGRVELIQNKPQIFISKKEQLVVLENTTSITKVSSNSTEPILARAPAFPGGQEVWIQFLNRNLNPSPELAAGEKKIVVVQFLVSADGTASNFRITQSAGSSFDNEVLRVLKRMPKWKCAIENGRPVNAVVTQSITFVGTRAASKLPL